SAALAAIAFSLSTTVLGEIDRTATGVDGLRAYYLAAGGVHRAIYEVLWSGQNPGARLLPENATRVDYNFPSAVVRVAILPETGKLGVNTALPEELFRLGVALGLSPERAQEIAMGIVDWRTPGVEGSPLDSYYLSLTPSFRPRHASMEEIEELLLVKGVTPEI